MSQPDPTLFPNDVNFPQLQSPPHSAPAKSIQSPNHQELANATPSFVWRMRAATEGKTQEKGKGKAKPTPVDSAPITRQGYRSGYLAEDFWSALGMPKIPQAPRKKLTVIPFIIKQQDQSEYLVDTKAKAMSVITQVQIAEVLAGIPWTTQRARQHVVNEVAQSLHKVLVFSNSSTSPFQRWTQGRWFSQWAQTADGEFTCTMYVSIVVPENKIKVRKGKDIGWTKIPQATQAILATTAAEEIQEVEDTEACWQETAGHEEESQADYNPFSVLREEETPEGGKTNDMR